MKITDVKTLVMGTSWRNLTFVKVETDEGLTGVSEVRMNNRTDALVAYIDGAKRRHVIGSDPFNTEDLYQRLFRDDYGRAGEIVATGISVIEIACWDIIGKAVNQPVYRLLGGACRDKIKAYANGWYRVERSSEEFHAAAKRVLEKGYRALKFDPFGAGYYELSYEEKLKSVELVEAVRDAVGPDVEILVEMHGRFSPYMAIEISAELEKFQPSWVEEPVPPDNIAALAKAAEKINLPVATGERLHNKYEYRELINLQAADILQPDITQTGGFLETKKIAAMGDMCYMTVAPHNVGGPVSTATALHFAACTTNFKIQEHFNDFSEAWVKEAATGCPEVIDGYFSLPNGPGLGMELNEDLIAEHPYREGSFNLFENDWHKREY
ncbi:mandelate racemase/muconate lactonizing enzyme family protein [Candidatus Poribacteria bacterium]|nr:mandelate racemase/muconate lactonizing enzyme family protein [Candidatus Poribacteria bacterium]MYA58537.1 mandelate racemase/muconate lactonizing enzyme family protein [Candidatus Poribacteria bacterium]